MRLTRTRVLLATTVAAALGAGAFAIGGIAGADLESQFTVYNGTIRTARGTPIPPSGTEASLWGNRSYATTVVDGHGRVVVGAIGSNCNGWPTIRVLVDGQVAGEATITSATSYGAYPIGSPVGAGRHTVEIRFVNDAATSTCDRNVHLGYARMENTGPVRPGPTNTGVPAGTRLRVHDRDLVISADNTVIDGLDVHGFVVVQAKNVTIRNTLVRGRPTTVGTALVATWDSRQSGLVIEDSTLAADHPSPYVNGIGGSRFTARRLKIHNVVDQVVIFGNDTSVTDSYLYGNTHFDDDPFHPDGSHDDNIQIEGGTNILIRNNTMQDAYNAGIMVTQNRARTSGVRVEGNLMSGGGCTINLSEKGKGPITNFSIRDNLFGTSRLNRCGVIAPRTSVPTMQNNFYLDGTPVAVSRGG